MKTKHTFSFLLCLVLSSTLLWGANENQKKDAQLTLVKNANERIVLKAEALSINLEDNDFEENFDNSESLNNWSYYDANEDEMTWGISSYRGIDFSGSLLYSYHTSNAANDWMFTPKLALKTGEQYEINFYYAVGNLSSTIYPEKFKIAYGTDPLHGTMTTIHDFGEVRDTNYIKTSQTFSVDTDNDYSIGFHCYSDANQYYLTIDSLVIKKISNTSSNDSPSETLIAHYPFENALTNELENSPVTINPTIADSRVSGGELHLTRTTASSLSLELNTTDYKGIKIETESKYVAMDNYTLCGINIRNGLEEVQLSHNKYNYSSNNTAGIYTNRNTCHLKGITYNSSNAVSNYSVSDVKLANSFDVWLKETLSIDYTTKKATYTRLNLSNNTSETIELSDITLLQGDTTKITLAVWDWGNDATLDLKYLKIYNSTSGNSSSNAGDSTQTEEEVWTNYTTENTGSNGLLDNDINSYLKDKKGNIWYAHESGISVYDGTNWKSYDKADGLGNNNASCLFEDSQGNIWIGHSYGGVTQYDGTSFSNYNTTHSSVKCIEEAADGTIWVGTIGGVAYLNGSYFSNISGLPSSTGYDLEFDNSGNLWMGGAKGLCKYDGATITIYDTNNGLPGGSNYVNAIQKDNNGNLWLGTGSYSGGIIKYDGTTFTQYTKDNGAVNESISDIEMDSQGTLWFTSYSEELISYSNGSFTLHLAQGELDCYTIDDLYINALSHKVMASNNGVFTYDGTSTSHFSTDDGGLIDNYIQSIGQDKDGNMLFGIYQHGLVSLTPEGNFSLLAEENTIKDNDIECIYTASDGKIWIGYGYSDGVSVYEGTTWTHYSTSDGLGSNNVEAITEDADGNIWLATSSHGATKYDGTTFTAYGESEGIVNKYSQCIAADGNTIYVGSSGGVSIYKNGSWTTQTKEDGLVDNDVEAIAIYKGKAWFGTNYSGISEYDGTTYITHNNSNGLSKSDDIYALDVDLNEQLWAATHGGGIAKYNGSEWTTYTVDSGLVYDYVRGVFCDKEGQIWAITTKGISKYSVTNTGTTQPTEHWDTPTFTAYNTETADMVHRTGDIDNLGFGWPSDFDPFSGSSTPSHSWPFTTEADDPAGTDKIMVISSYDYTSSQSRDGYASSTSRPNNRPVAITLNYDLKSIPINTVVIQLFVDDFQAHTWGANYQVTIDNVRIPELEVMINALSQTGPIGKLITLQLSSEYNALFQDGSASLLIDDPTTGSGDGFGIDFVRILVNPSNYTNTGSISGTITDGTSALEGVTLEAAGYISTTTDASGNYTLSNIPAGVILVKISKEGYTTKNTLIEVNKDGSANLNLALSKEIKALKAKFEATSSTTGEAPLMVSFAYLSGDNTASPTSWAWDFGDGSTESSSMMGFVMHSYTSPGTYDVKLVVANSEGKDSMTIENYITVLPAASKENEPNDSYDAANTIALNTPVQGLLSSTDNSDWYTFTTPYDGAISVVVEPSDTLNASVYLYFENGTSYWSGCTSCGGEGQNDTIYKDDVKAGTYYFYVGKEYYSDGAYSVSVNLQATAYADGNDKETNATYTDAITLNEDEHKTGHIGYLNLAGKDEQDWYSINLEDDAALQIVVAPEARLNSNIHFYFNDGSTYWSGCTSCGGEGENDTVYIDDVKAGTYYFKVTPANYWDNGSYSISYSVINAQMANDSEPNNTYAQAISLEENNGKTGHIGYINVDGKDDKDWYTITLKEDGKLTLVVTPEERFNSTLYFYGTDGTSYWSGCTSCGGEGENDTVYIDDIQAGTYYFKVYNANYWDNGSYAVKYEFETCLYANDVEPNNTYSEATGIAIDETKTGHIGFRNVSKHDDADWYQFTIGEVESFSVVVSPDAVCNTTLSLYDATGSTYLSGCTKCGGEGENDTLIYHSPKASEYYVNVYRANYWDNGSYQIKVITSASTTSLSAAFSADITSGETPLTVQFTDSSVGASSWSWDFDNDGITDSELQSPNFTYTQAGIYTVKLSVSNGTDSDIAVKTNYITVSQSSTTPLDTGLTVLTSNTDNDLNAVHFPSEKVGYAVGKGGSILKTNDRGANWTNISTSAHVHEMTDVFFINETTGFVIGEWLSGAFAPILKTTDGGATWTDKAVIANDGSSIHFINESVGYYANLSGIRKTTDGGENWTALTNPTSGYTTKPYRIYFIDENTGYLGTNLAYVDALYETTDGGVNWSRKTTDGEGIYAIDAANGVVFAAATSKIYIKGENGWSFGKKTGKYGMRTMDVISDQVIYVAGTDGLFLKSIDQAKTWKNIDLASQKDIADMCFVNDTVGYLVGESGTIMRYVSTTSSNTVNSLSYATAIPRITLYPNPAKNTFEIEANTRINEVEIVDIHGSRVAMYQAVENPAIEININHLNSGLYIVKVTTDQGMQIKQLIKQ